MAKKKRVVHIITGLADGGAEAVLYRLISKERAYEHIVISLNDGGKYEKTLTDIGIKVITIGMSPNIKSIHLFYKLFRILKKLDADIVQTWMYHADFFGGLAAKLSGVKNIFWGLHHTTLDIKGSSKNTLIICKINSFLSNYIPKKIIACAEESAKVHKAIGYKECKVIVVPNGHEVDKYYPMSEARKKVRHEFKINDDVVCVGMVARYNPQKDHINLISALGILKKKNVNFKALLIGGNVDKNNKILVKAIKNENLTKSVELLGSRSDIPQIMNALDIHILSSSFGEAFPNVLCEAMSCGTRCVSTNVGDASIIIGNTGEIVKPKNPIELAEALLKMSLKEGVFKRSILARERIVNNFSLDKMVDSYVNIWESK